MEGIIVFWISNISSDSITKFIKFYFFHLTPCVLENSEGWIEILNMATPGTLMKLALM